MYFFTVFDVTGVVIAAMVTALPIGIAEPVVGLWLLIRGIDLHQQASRAVGS